MDSEIQPPLEGGPAPEVSEPALAQETSSSPDALALKPAPYRGLRWIFIGPEGLRGGWSILVFVVVFLLILRTEAFLVTKSHLMGPKGGPFTPLKAFVSELMTVLGILGGATVVVLIEHRRLMDFYLTGPRRVPRFFAGIATGFVALSSLVGLLAWGGWLHYGGFSLSGIEILRYALVWGVTFLLVGCAEEGLMRCYLQFTLARSLNFWWALGLIAAMCAFLIWKVQGNGVWGVYSVALLGLLPCLYLHLKSAPSSGFWQAAWVTSTAFGFLHTSNGGENWIGIFSAAAIGFIFCVSIRVTGSVWWAIGCHAGWDWAETYFYGTADSGMVAPGHLLSTTAIGNPFWSGGTDGPEGSVMILAVLAMLLAWLLLIYGRKSAPVPEIVAAEEASA